MNTVVIVDCDSRWIVNYKRMLAAFQEEWDCRYFQFPEEAMEYMASHPTAVLVSELDMPVLSGKELFEMVEMLSPFTIRIAMTQVRDVAETLEILNQTPVFRLILKPFFLVEDLADPIQAALKAYESGEKERNAQEAAKQELLEVNLKLEALQRKLEDKKRGYEGIQRAVRGMIMENLKPEVSGLQAGEAQIAAGFCERLLQEFMGYYLFENQNFIFHINYLKNQFHHPGRKCRFQIFNKTGGEIPADLMNRMGYGIFLGGYLCQQLLESYQAAALIEQENSFYVVRIFYQYPEKAAVYRIESPRVQKLLRRVIRELLGVLSDGMAGASREQGLIAKLYFKREEEQQ